MTRGGAPRLSVVVPFFDVEHYFADCLDSLVRQTFQDIEVVMVDDGSRDGSAAIAREAVAHDARFRIVEQENQGLGPARNTGAAHARGEYITFVDSDDLVTRHGFERMVASLDRTGSSFAASGARRFDSTGVRPSWVHTVPFAQDRIATHVLEFPSLALDRMVWNKVYRRSFWEHYDYRFPAIRYEDYPVTLKAHLDAATVDVLSAPSYYWRDRDFGASITQLKYEYGNLLDRVVSAEMVTALVRDQPAPVRAEVHHHFAQVDLMALVQAFSTVPPEREIELVALGKRLTALLDADAIGKRGRFDLIQLGALKQGDIPLLRELARFREEGGLRTGAKMARRAPGVWEYAYPGRERTRSRRLYRVARAALRPHTTVTGLRWAGTSVVVHGTAEYRHLGPDRAVELTLSLANGASRFPCAVERYDAPDSRGELAPVGFRATIDLESVRGRLDPGKSVRLLLGLRAGTTRRRTELRGLQAGEPQWPGGVMLSDGTWVQPRAASDGHLLLVFHRQPWRLLEAIVDGEDFVLRCALPGVVGEAALVMARGGGAALRTALQHEDGVWTGRVPFSAVLDAANPDDPFTQRTTRSVKVEADGREEWLLCTGPTSSLSVVREDRLLLLTRSPGALVNLQERPVRPVADAVQTGVTGQLTVSGPAVTQPQGRVFWRRALPDGELVDVPCALVTGAEQWSAQAEVAALVSEDADTAHDLDWVLFADVPDHPALAISADPFLLGRLPCDVAVSGSSGRRLRVTPRSDSLHAVARRTLEAEAR